MDERRASERVHAIRPPCYGERRRDIEWAHPGTTWPPPLSKALALCHVAAHNEAARWASVILAPGLVFCLPENSLLCRAALRPTAVSFRTGSSVRLVMYDIRISIKAFNTRDRPSFDAERAAEVISVVQ